MDLEIIETVLTCIRLALVVLAVGALAAASWYIFVREDKSSLPWHRNSKHSTAELPPDQRD